MALQQKPGLSRLSARADGVTLEPASVTLEPASVTLEPASVTLEPASGRPWQCRVNDGELVLSP